MKLSDLTCKRAKPREKSYKLSYGAGLYLEVMPNGRKYWRQKYRFDGRERRLAHGVYPEVSLAEAREKRDAARRLLANGGEPGRKQKSENRAVTFEDVAREWHATKRKNLFKISTMACCEWRFSCVSSITYHSYAQSEASENHHSRCALARF